MKLKVLFSTPSLSFSLRNPPPPPFSICFCPASEGVKGWGMGGEVGGWWSGVEGGGVRGCYRNSCFVHSLKRYQFATLSPTGDSVLTMHGKQEFI